MAAQTVTLTATLAQLAAEIDATKSSYQKAGQVGGPINILTSFAVFLTAKRADGSVITGIATELGVASKGASPAHQPRFTVTESGVSGQYMFTIQLPELGDYDLVLTRNGVIMDQFGIDPHEGIPK